jgi:nucleoside-diphosphate-sugar epimerase
MARLITGGSGLVGSELARRLLKENEEVVIFDVVKSNRLKDIEGKITFVKGDLGNYPEVFNIVKDNKISHIYHMGAMLTFESEINPWGSFQSNVVGTYNILEAARLLGVKQLMFTSSIGTFGETQGDVMSDIALQRPRDFYGVGKLYCEGLGRMYRQKFGLDFRAIRYPSVVGAGVNTPNHWDAPMMRSLVQGKPFQCNAPGDMAGPMLYYKDAAKAAEDVLRAPKDDIKMIVYNVGAISASPKDMENTVRKYLPEASVSYPPKAGPQPPRLRSWDDSYARKEWGWSPEYSDIDKIVLGFIDEIRQNPELYR